MDHETLVSYMLKKSDAKLDFGDIYIKRPHEEDQLKGRKERKIRYVGKGAYCFSVRLFMQKVLNWNLAIRLISLNNSNMCLM